MKPPVSATVLLAVAKTWAGQDDWGVQTISLASLRDLRDALQAGDSPAGLRAHAKHTLSECVKQRCDDVVPYTVEHDELTVNNLTFSQRIKVERAKALDRCSACGFHRGYHAEDCDR